LDQGVDGPTDGRLDDETDDQGTDGDAELSPRELEAERLQRRQRAIGSAVPLLGQCLDLGAVRGDECKLTGDVEPVDQDEGENGENAEKGLDGCRLDRSSARKRRPG
jgi:hypothetical protein